MKRLWLALPLFLGACSKETTQVVNEGGGVDSGPYVDEDAPVIEHIPIETSQTFMTAVRITATVTDDYAGVDKVELFYKREDKASWSTVAMPVADEATGVFAADIPASDVQSGGMDYYLHAVDKSANEAQMPTEGEANPYHFRIDGG